MQSLKSLLSSTSVRVRSRVKLTELDVIGRHARVQGTPWIENLGSMHVGSRLTLVSEPLPVHLFTTEGSTLAIGDHVSIGSGASIAARCNIRIGSRVRIGARCYIVGDTDDVEIADDVVLEEEVVVLAGARIGAGTRVARGSVVSDVVPAHTVFEGVSASSASSRRSTAARKMLAPLREVVASVVPGARDFDASAELVGVAGWTSLTALQVLVAIESAFGVILPAHFFALNKVTLESLCEALLTDHVEERSVPEARSQSPAQLEMMKRAASQVDAGNSTVLKLYNELAWAAWTVRPKTWAWLRVANALPNFTFAGVRARCLRAAGCDIKDGTAVTGTVYLAGDSCAERLHIDEGCIIGPGVTFALDGEIWIGRHVSISPHVMMHTGTHDLSIGKRRMNVHLIRRDIHIEDGAWIGMSALIMPGVRIGAGAVVSAGAVVTSDVAPDTLVAGNPARPVQKLPRQKRDG